MAHLMEHTRKWVFPRHIVTIAAVIAAAAALLSPVLTWSKLEVGSYTDTGICVGVAVSVSPEPVCGEITISGYELAQAADRVDQAPVAQDRTAIRLNDAALPTSFGFPSASIWVLAVAALAGFAAVFRKPLAGIAALIAFVAFAQPAFTETKALIETSSNSAFRTSFGIGYKLVSSDLSGLSVFVLAASATVVSAGAWSAHRKDQRANGHETPNALTNLLEGLMSRLPAPPAARD